MKVHDEKWFEKQEKRLTEPFKNTKRYYGAWWKIASLVLIPKVIVDMGRYKFHKTVFEMQSANYLDTCRAVTLVGPPGCGKTFGASNFAVMVAAGQFARLESDYLLQRELYPKWVAEANTDKILSFKALEESYMYYKERESFAIPCLVSSIPVKDEYGRFSYQLTDEVALQIKRCPEYTVLFNDESGLSQGANTSKKASTDILDFYRCNRHFGDFILINTEQGGDGNGKYIRKVTDYNIRLRRQKTVMAPLAAEMRFARQKRRFFKKLRKGKLTDERQKYLGEKLYYRELYLRTIGFREIPYRFEATEGNIVDLEKGKYIFPRLGMGLYDSRAYRLLYKCKDKPIDLKVWTSLLIEEADLHEFDNLISEKKSA